MKIYLNFLKILAAISLIPALELFSMVPNDSLEAMKLYKKGDDFWRDVRYDSSNYYYQNASGLFKKYGNWMEYIDCEQKMGINYMFLGNYSGAVTHLNDGLKAVDNLKEKQDSIRSELYSTLGNIYSERGNFDKAFKYYRDMLEINKRIFGEKNPNTGKAYQNIGLIYYRKGNYPGALQYFGSALSIFDSTLTKDNPLLAGCYAQVSKVYLAGEEYSKAIEFEEKALKIWIDKLGETHPYIAANYNELASAYSHTGTYDKALEYAYKSMQIRRDYAGEESRLTAESYKDMGKIFIEMGDLNNGRYFLDKSINIYKKVDPANPGLSEAYIFSGNLQRKKTEFETSEAYYDSALYVAWPGYNPGDLRPDYLNNMPVEEQFLAALIKKADNLFTMADKSDDVTLLNKTLDVYNIISGLINRIDSDAGQSESLLMIKKRAREINNKGILTALRLFKLSGDQLYLESAFQFSERDKTGMLAESLEESDIKKITGLPDSLMDEEKELETDLLQFNRKLYEAREQNNLKAIGEYRNRLLTVRREYDELSDSLRRTSPLYHNLIHPEQITSSNEIRKLLPDDAAFLEYFTGDTTITIFVFTDNSANAVTVDCSPDFVNEVAKFLESLKEKNFISYFSLASDLYSKLIEPVKDFLNDGERLYIIPDYSLVYLPFEALLTEPLTGTFNGKFNKLPYLINDYCLSYHYSAELLKETLLQKNDNSEMSFVGFAPVFIKEYRAAENSDLSRVNTVRPDSLADKTGTSLPLTEIEVKSIDKLFKENNFRSDIFIKKASTRSELESEKMKAYKFIHLAANCILNEENPVLSGLSLFAAAADTTGNGILNPGDIYNLNLNADLLVLSACDANPGNIVHSKGIYSITRGFLYAGAKNIVLSLWQNADRSTSALMLNFYKNRLDGMDYASALRKAKMDLIRDGQYSYPLFWSPFILIGR